MAGADTPKRSPAQIKAAKENLKPAWKPGQSGNPAGRPKGARSKLSEDFCQALLDDFSSNGAEAIQLMRVERPNEYAKMIAGILTQEVDVSGNLFNGLDVNIKR